MADGGDYTVCLMDGQPVGGIMPATDEAGIPGVGRIAIVRDRAGSAVGWITPAAPADEASPHGSRVRM